MRMMMTKQQIIKELRKVRRELKIVYETNLIPKRDRAINYTYDKINEIIESEKQELITPRDATFGWHFFCLGFGDSGSG